MDLFSKMTTMLQIIKFTFITSIILNKFNIKIKNMCPIKMKVV